jgi:hypothetical protein
MSNRPFFMPPTKRRKSRPVRQQLRAKRVTLSDRRGGQLEVTCVIATEINAPPGETPIEWRLLTNRDVKDFAAAAELVDCVVPASVRDRLTEG